MSEESLGTLQLATILKGNNISCDILQFFKIGDLSDFQPFLDNAIAILMQQQPKIVSFYTRCDCYHIVLKLAQRIKAWRSDIYIVFGGPQSDITSQETIRQIPYVDFICCGEGENTIVPFFRSLLQGTPDMSVDGLVFRKGEEVVVNPRPKMVEDLDSLPFLDYSLFAFSGDGNKKKKIFTIDVGRGCPFACTFCSTNTFWGRTFRLKSPKRIVEEVKQIHNTFGKSYFNFSHDMFTFNRKKVIETCDLLQTLDFPIQWGCSARVDCIDFELIDIMAQSGMVDIFLGIETGSPRMQKLINKRLKLDRVLDIVSYLKSKGIRTVTSFIYGFPEETEEDLSQTMALIGELLKLRSVRLGLHLCTFLVGTEITRKYAAELTPAELHSDIIGDSAVEECQDLIQAHPALFQHMLEYKTELRSKLEYFTLFFNVWNRNQPVYQYLSEKYPAERLIDMYYDFLDANQDFLSRCKDIPEAQWSSTLVLEDRFPLRFADDENYDIITDLNRIKKIEYSQEVQNGGTVSDIFCINPAEIETKPLQEYTRCYALVTWSENQRHIMITPIE